MKLAAIKKSLILGTAALALLFTSCENFLKAQDTAEQIKEAIEIANSNPTSIYIEAERDSGTVTPAQVRVKKHETFEMKFTPADNWKFIGWEVLDRTTLKPVTDAVKFDDATKLEVKATLLNPVDNLVIRPKCLQLPAIVSVTPSDTDASYANTPIKITFNMPMEAADVTAENSIFKYDAQNISITLGSVDITEYFETPRFNSDKTILTIVPKAAQMLAFITTLNKPFIDIQLSFGNNIAVTNGENVFTLATENQSIFIRYKRVVETTAPSKYDFFAATNSDSETHFTQTALSSFGNAEILQNRTEGSIYIYGRYYDSESGVNTIRITEKHTNAKDGSEINTPQKVTEYTAANTDFITDGNGTTTFGIKHNLKSEEGAILIGITVLDGCENAAPEQTFTVIKDSGIDLDGIDLYNFKNPITSGTYFTYENTENGTRIQYDDWPSIVRSLKLNPIEKRVYKDFIIPETELKGVSLTYNSTAHAMTFDSVANLWKFDIPIETDVSGLAITLTVEDYLGNKATKEFAFPDIPTILDIAQSQEYDYEYTAYLLSNFNFTRIASVYDIRYSETADGPTVSADELYEGDYPEYSRYSLSNPNSMTISMRGVVPDFYRYNSNQYYGIYSNYRFFLVENQLAGLMTEEITISDAISIDSTLPAVGISEATETVSEDGNFLIIDIKMDTSTYNPWETYNSILVQFATNPTYPSVTSFVDKNSTSFSISIPYTAKIYNSYPFIRLIGITDTKKSPDYTYVGAYEPGWYLLEIPFENRDKFEKVKPTVLSSDGIASISAMYMSEGLNIPARYDYMMPVLAEDYQSGLKKIIINANDCIWTYSINDFYSLGNNSQGYPNHFQFKDGNDVYDAGSSFRLPLIWDADKELNELTITYYDSYDNCSVWSGNFISAKIPSFTHQSDGTFKSEETTETLYQCHLGILKFNSSNAWEKVKEVTTAPVESTGTNNGKIYTYSSETLSSNTFIKIIATAAFENDTMSKNFGNSVPTYFYTGATKNSGDYDYIIKNGSSKTSVLIASDAPTFVHTLVTKYPMSECQNWSVERWEHNHKHIGDKQISFTAENTTAKKYTIPVDQMDDGDCYVVIAHFADGTSAISEVMQK